MLTSVLLFFSLAVFGGTDKSLTQNVEFSHQTEQWINLESEPINENG